MVAVRTILTWAIPVLISGAVLFSWPSAHWASAAPSGIPRQPITGADPPLLPPLFRSGVLAAASSPTTGCSGTPVETGGHRRLALIVGVSDYKSDRVPDLPGAKKDAQLMLELLTGKGGYGFPRENVCMLLDGAATTEGFKQAFERTLVQNARPGDVAVIYFAGHGSQSKDLNGDEPDEWDETLLLHDARVGNVRDLRDDELNGMLGRLYEKTQRVTVILDACNSGSATRNNTVPAGARYQPPEENRGGVPVTEPPSAGDGGEAWTPASMPGLVFMAAAGDGTSALEKNGHGVFTTALVTVLGEPAREPLSYAMVARRVPPLVAAESGQIPSFQGALEGSVFGSTDRVRPLAWEITSIGQRYGVKGVPLPGWTAGAELRVYDGAATQAEVLDPARAKAALVLEQADGISGLARRIDAPRSGERPIKVGDLAILVRPGDAALRVPFRIVPASAPDGVPSARAASIRAAIEADEVSRSLVEFSATGPAFELSADPQGQLELRGPEGRVRTVYTAKKGQEGETLAKNLWQHARQLALLRLEGEGGQDFANNETLEVQVVPAKKQDTCADGEWVQAPPNEEQVIPLCHNWQVRVSLSAGAPVPLLVGGGVLFSDGSSLGFPTDGTSVRLEPGSSTTFAATFKATPPLDAQDHVLVFGTREDNPVEWRKLTQKAFRANSPNTLAGALEHYLTPGDRAAMQPRVLTSSTWTSTHITTRVEANSRFLQGGDGSGVPQKREYTLSNFDLRPYLPESARSALYQVLQKADWLARYAASDGVRYKQHGWTARTDAENLKLGIDCSRSIWFAFTRAGLSFNRGNRYLSTREMRNLNGTMSEEFTACTDDLQIGDVLVYRDEGRDAGHTVMVIDPEKRIAWGSHGWDGNVRDGSAETTDTGVEYQRIKYKKDWQRWDRTSMQRVACWRHKAFIRDRQQAGSRPGASALANACDLEKQCGRGNPE